MSTTLSDPKQQGGKKERVLGVKCQLLFSSNLGKLWHCAKGSFQRPRKGTDATNMITLPKAMCLSTWNGAGGQNTTSTGE